MACSLQLSPDGFEHNADFSRRRRHEVYGALLISPFNEGVNLGGAVCKKNKTFGRYLFKRGVDGY